MKHAKELSVLLIILSFICVTTFTFAIKDPNFYEPDGLNSVDSEKTGRMIGDVLANIKVVGICISVVMLTIIGLKYMISSVDEKATYKENMTPYIVGCFLLASATTIPSIVYDLVNK